MSKVKAREVLRLVTGEGFESLGYFKTQAIANWHINNTFNEKFGGDKLIVRPAEVRAGQLYKEEVADDKGKYFHVLAEMPEFDWEGLKYSTTPTTLLGAIVDGVVKSESGLGKIENLGIEDGFVRVQLLLGEEDAVPFAKITTALQNEVLNEVAGDTADDGEDAEEVEEPEQKEEPKEKDKPKKKPKPEPKKEVEPEPEPEPEPEEDLEDEDLEDEDLEDEDLEDEDLDDEDLEDEDLEDEDLEDEDLEDEDLEDEDLEDEDLDDEDLDDEDLEDEDLDDEDYEDEEDDDDETEDDLDFGELDDL